MRWLWYNDTMLTHFAANKNMFNPIYRSWSTYLVLNTNEIKTSDKIQVHTRSTRYNRYLR